MKTQRIGAGEFKTHCLKMIDEVAKQHLEMIITKRGCPLVKLIPFEEHKPSLFGALKGTVTIVGDIVEPMDDPWEANE